jgi:hypothetical protein
MCKTLDELVEKEQELERENFFPSISGMYDCTYEQALERPEWKRLRREVLRTQGHRCRKCGKQETWNKWDPENETWNYYEVVIPGHCRKYLNSYEVNGGTEFYHILDDRDFVITKVARPTCLHVHHRYYICGRSPWQYHPDCFECLCLYCHFDLHKKTRIPMYFLNNGLLIETEDLVTCPRCNGAGGFPEYRHVMAGVCFRCSGSRYMLPSKRKQIA